MNEHDDLRNGNTQGSAAHDGKKCVRYLFGKCVHNFRNARHKQFQLFLGYSKQELVEFAYQ